MAVAIQATLVAVPPQAADSLSVCLSSYRLTSTCSGWSPSTWAATSFAWPTSASQDCTVSCPTCRVRFCARGSRRPDNCGSGWQWVVVMAAAVVVVAGGANNAMDGDDVAMLWFTHTTTVIGQSPLSKPLTRTTHLPYRTCHASSPVFVCNVTGLRAADVVIVVAGMDGALPSVVAGLVTAPVVSVLYCLCTRFEPCLHWRLQRGGFRVTNCSPGLCFCIHHQPCRQ